MADQDDDDDADSSGDHIIGTIAPLSVDSKGNRYEGPAKPLYGRSVPASDFVGLAPAVGEDKYRPQR